MPSKSGIVAAILCLALSCAGTARAADDRAGLLWRQTYGTAFEGIDELRARIAPAGDGLVLVATERRGSGYFYEVWFRRLTADGTLRQEHRIGLRERALLNDMAILADGGIVIGGYHLLAGRVEAWIDGLDASGGRLWAWTDPPPGQHGQTDVKRILPAGGGFTAFGERREAGSRQGNVVLHHFPPGATQATDVRRYGPGVGARIWDVAATGDGGFLLGGSQVDSWVLRLGAGADIAWEARPTRSQDGASGEVWALAVLENGRLALAEEQRPYKGKSSYRVVLLDADGRQVRAVPLSSEQTDRPARIAALADGSFAVLYGQAKIAQFDGDGNLLRRVDLKGPEPWLELSDIHPGPGGTLLLAGQEIRYQQGSRTWAGALESIADFQARALADKRAEEERQAAARRAEEDRKAAEAARRAAAAKARAEHEAKLIAGLAKTSEFRIVAASRGNIRELPEAAAAVVRQADKGTRLHITGRLPSDWLQVSEEGVAVGWVHASVLEGPAKVAAPRGAAPAPAGRFAGTPLAVDYRKGEPRPDDIAVIIGNADYASQGRDIPDVTPARADAASFKRYAVEALGIRPGNIIFETDATAAKLQRIFGTETDHKGQLFDWVRPGRSRVWVYYAGHGAPAADGSAYLVPADADAARINLNGYPLATLYRNLGKLPAAGVTVVLEACFSGASQNGTLLPKTSGLYVEPRAVPPPAGMTIIAAGRADQVASWEEDGSHGLFTKYYLTGMAGAADQTPYGNGDGSADLDELQRYLVDTMTYYARRYYGRDQHAQVHRPAADRVGGTTP